MISPTVLFQQIEELKNQHSAELAQGETLKATGVANKINMIAKSEQPNLGASDQQRLSESVMPIIMWLAREFMTAENYRDDINALLNKSDAT